MDKIYHFIKLTSAVPKWVIFILDIFICLFSIIYANLLRFDFDYSILRQDNTLLQIVTVTIINAFFFRIFHTYEGIIRLSSIEEGFRCILSIFCSFFLLSIANLISSTFNLLHLVPISIIFIYFFSSSFLIFGYRIIVKNLYRQSIKKIMSTQNVLIASGANHGSLIRKAMEQMSSSKPYNVVGFIEENQQYWGKKIDDIKVYSFDQVKEIIKPLKIKLVLLADENMTIELKNNIVDYCLEHLIQVKIIPPVQSWIQGNLNYKQIKDIKIEDLLNRPAIQLANAHIQKFIKQKRVLITGAAGSIGSEIAQQIAAIEPVMLILYDQNETGLYEINYQIEKSYGGNENTKVCIGDIRDRKSLAHLFAIYKPEVVFHAAAYKHVPMMENNPSEAILNNLLGTKILADLSKSYGVERFVFVSTDKAINPTNVMGASKRLAEMYVQSLQDSRREFIVDSEGNFRMRQEPLNHNCHTKFIITRFGNVLGSNGSVIPRFKEQIKSGGPVTITHPDVIRYFMTIPEACSLVLEAGTMGKGGEIFIFDMGEPVKIVDLAWKMIKLSGLIPNKDIKIEFTGLRPGEKLFEELLNKKELVMPTHHKKIMIAKASSKELEPLMININLIIKLASEHKDFQMVQQMKMIIPDFISQNSHFDVLDNELNKTMILQPN